MKVNKDLDLTLIKVIGVVILIKVLSFTFFLPASIV
ncbi:hypothetical protein SAMN05421690_1001150 [Nitrosomonas sp. Nm51]|nr:hypothetical protein SAMN05421690_1001150 [Nitrosomonas sp. Nm51]